MSIFWGILSVSNVIFVSCSTVQLRAEPTATNVIDRQLEAAVEVNHINYLYSSKETPYHWFGEAVEVNENMAIVGAPGAEDGNYGAVYVYSQQGSGSDQSWKELAVLEATTDGEYDGFGTTVSIYSACAFVGAPK
jgi:hypothetical protein